MSKIKDAYWQEIEDLWYAEVSTEYQQQIPAKL